MAEDRFGDLGPQRRHDGEPPAGGAQPSAAERLAELDERRPEQPPKPPEERRPRARYSWVIGVAFVIVIVVAGINSLPNKGEGVRGPKPGETAPAFAAPLATSKLNGDANVKQKASQSDQLGRVPACQVHGPGIFNLCDATARRPLVLTFIVTRGANCTPELDRVEQVRRRFQGVGFAAVVSGDKRSDVQSLVERHGWRFPVAVDHDGELVNVYGIGVCPTTVLLEPGRRVKATKLGNLTTAQLAAQARSLARSVQP